MKTTRTKRLTVAIATVAALCGAVSACGSSSEGQAPDAPKSPQKAAVDCTSQTLSEAEWVKHCADPEDAPKAPQDGVQKAEMGEPVKVYGALGSEIEMTLTGVAYADAHAKSADTDAPYAVAYAFELRSAATDRLGPTIDGFEYRWAKGPDKFTDFDTEAPWDGCMNAYASDTDLIPGETFHAIEATNATSKGGTLTFRDPSGTVIRWELPKSDAGTGTEPATKYVTEYC